MSLLPLTAKPLKSDVDVHNCFYNPASLCFHIATLITITNYFNASKYRDPPSVIERQSLSLLLSLLKTSSVL